MESQGSFKVDKGGRREARIRERFEGATLLALKMKRLRAEERRWLLEGGKGKETDSSPEPPEGRSPAKILILTQRAPFWTSDFYNRKIQLWCCLKPLNLW